MSTRATYEFKPSPNGYQPPIAFYVHYDGYEEGAARYFYEALLFENERGGLSAQFFRAVDVAEFTGGHATHGDTEYRYTVTGTGPHAEIKVEARQRGQGWSDRWPVTFAGTVVEFIDRYPGMIDDYKPFKMVEAGWRKRWLNAVTAQRVLDESIRTLTIWAANTGPKTSPVNEGNWRSQCREAGALLAAFPADLKVIETFDYTRHRFNAPPTTTTYTVPDIVLNEVAGEVEKLTAKGGA